MNSLNDHLALFTCAYYVDACHPLNIARVATIDRTSVSIRRASFVQFKHGCCTSKIRTLPIDKVSSLKLTRKAERHGGIAT